MSAPQAFTLPAQPDHTRKQPDAPPIRHCIGTLASADITEHQHGRRSRND